jgi:tripartite ATP-independent transporter DctM subunit
MPLLVKGDTFMILILVISFIILAIIGIPVAYSLGLASLIAIIVNGLPTAILPQRMFIGLNSFSILALPLFVLSGDLMNETGIAKKLIDFSKLIIGKITGGLAVANIVASMFFAGITGSGTADTSALGSVLIPAMEKDGYDRPFSAAVTAASSVIGPIIPPSSIMVLTGIAAEVSIGGLFVAGYVPGILLGLISIIITVFISKKRGYGRYVESLTFKEKFNITKQAIPVLIMPIIIIGGIMSGIFTPTESAGVATLYALMYGIITRKLNLKSLKKVLISSCSTSGPVLIIISTAMLVSWILATNQVPQMISDWFTTYIGSKYLFLMLINVLFLIIGCFMEAAAAIIIFVPTLMKVAIIMGLSPLHFAFLLGFNLCLGLSTPPLGLCLYVASSISKVSIFKISREILPFYIGYVTILVLITYIPVMVLYLPKLFGFTL